VLALKGFSAACFGASWKLRCYVRPHHKEREKHDEARKDQAKLKSSDACFHISTSRPQFPDSRKEQALFEYVASERKRSRMASPWIVSRPLA
jgi:hypothetical protein